MLVPPAMQLPRLELGADDAPFRLLDHQADLTYHAAPVRAIFNPPAATGMGFWSINPYVGCAFACAYCYARDTHRWTLERAGDVGQRIAAIDAVVAGLRTTGAGEGERRAARARGAAVRRAHRGPASRW